MAKAGKRRKNAGYRTAVKGAGSILKILIYVCLAVFLVFLARQAYTLGYQVFDQVPVDSGEGREVAVVVTEEMSVSDVGDLLREEGLVEESSLVFWFQELFSDYHGEILPGSYILNTNQTVDEMLAILAQADTEGQPTSLNEGEASGTETQGGGEEP